LFLAISYFVHLVATVVWLGGLMVITVLVIPEVRRTLDENSPSFAALLGRLRARFTVIGNLCLVLLLVTGMLQMPGDDNYTGFLRVENAWSVAMLLKHVAIVGMIGIGLLLQFGVVPALERTRLLTERGKGDPTATAALRQREVRLTWLNIAMSIVVLACTAYATAL
jgi:uncharacterized membrane protein